MLVLAESGLLQGCCKYAPFLLTGQGRDPTTPSPSQSTPASAPSLVVGGATAGGMLAPLTSPLALPTPSPLPTAGAPGPTITAVVGGDGGAGVSAMDTSQGGQLPVITSVSGKTKQTSCGYKLRLGNSTMQLQLDSVITRL